MDIDKQMLVYRAALARQKVQYCQRLLDFQNGKIKSKPSKPIQIIIGEITSRCGVKPYAVSEMHQFDTQPPPLLQIEKEEVDAIV